MYIFSWYCGCDWERKPVCAWNRGSEGEGDHQRDLGDRSVRANHAMLDIRFSEFGSDCNAGRGNALQAKGKSSLSFGN